MILVTGASGTVGRPVLEEVAKTGKPVKAMYRNAEDARSAPAGVPTVIADFADIASLVKALQGIDTVFLVCSPIPQLVELESNVIAACKLSAVRHVVLNSALGAADYPKSFPSWHRKVEDKLSASCLGYIILRPNTFMQNIVAYNASSIRLQSAFYSAMGDAKISFIDVRDIADATAKILAEPAAHAGKIYELNGPQAFNYTEVASLISNAVGRPVQFVNIPEESQRKAMLDLGMPDWQVNALLDLQRYYTAEHKGADITPVLEQILGRPATRMQQYVIENKDAFRSQAAGA
ncbi:MAG TPA: SDR family oxidoreductase [Candidatus Limnocylindrales bacterium]|nr:SDR family oxidoreductase [Candidatus Limnocylindrales bacterium]